MAKRKKKRLLSTAFRVGTALGITNLPFEPTEKVKGINERSNVFKRKRKRKLKKEKAARAKITNRSLIGGR